METPDFKDVVRTGSLGKEAGAAEPQDHLGVLGDQAGHQVLVHQPHQP